MNEDEWLDIVEDDFEGDIDDDPMEALQNCSMLPDGTCMQAGSEECDLECPLGPLHNPKHWGLK